MTGFVVGVLLTGLVALVWRYGPRLLEALHEFRLATLRGMADDEIGELHRQARLRMQRVAGQSWRGPFEP
ncbi:hypothetical protein [Pseudactinotalea sp. HY158]|uniref:hypothetical protein n=1 Tax=Pseudactinotalea sp. HY158 TaxID=2654547 RepID=UPI00129CE987|nr:hypothetical protein [Pseudactinotalea sp. HY158]QGH68689.1 hypothetical protein GCE65_03635 [Pseudactinotalea sp. HY158]